MSTPDPTGRVDLVAVVTDLGRRADEELVAAHDYHTATRAAWRLVEQTVARGRRLTIQNRLTGNRITEADVPARAREYTRELTEATFQQFLSIFESFVTDLLSAALIADPLPLGEREVRLERVLRHGTNAVVAEEVDKFVKHAMNGGPRQWLEPLNKKCRFALPPADRIDLLVEAKATRDLLVHSRGIVNATYLDKAKLLARGVEGERIEVDGAYHQAVWELLRQLVGHLATVPLS